MPKEEKSHRATVITATAFRIALMESARGIRLLTKPKKDAADDKHDHDMNERHILMRLLILCHGRFVHRTPFQLKQEDKNQRIEVQ